MSVSATTSVALAVLLGVVLCAAAPEPKKDKKLKHVIITSFGEMPYEPLEGFVQADSVPVNLQGEEQNPTLDVALRTGILVEDPNEKKKDSAEDDDDDDDYRENRASRTAKTGEELFREFREKYRYAPRKNHKSSSNQWSPVIPSAGEGDFLQPRQPPAPPPGVDDGFNVDREYHGDIGEGWNLDDAVEVLQDRNYNVLSQSPSYPNPTLPPREIPPPRIPPMGQPLYPFPVPSFPLPFPGFNPLRRSRLLPLPPTDPRARARPQEQGVLRRQELAGIQLHPTRIGVPYSPDVVYGTRYLGGA